MTLNQLRKLNKHVRIKGITNLSFKKYGRIITGYDFTEIIGYMEKKTPIPGEGFIYVPSVKSMERLPIMKLLQDNFYGELSVQIGYMNGVNSKLNCMEYSKSNKIILAVTDMIIFLGRVQDIADDQYDTSKAEAYFVPEGVAIELYSNSLHSLPCIMETKGFKCTIISLKGTGSALKSEDNEDKLLNSKNRWLIAHEEAKEYSAREIKIGLVGENIEVFLQ